MTIEDGFDRWWNALSGSHFHQLPDGAWFDPKEARFIWDAAIASTMTEDSENPNCPDCHQVQCAQLHETLDSLLDMLGCKCSKRVYTVGKMVHICEALQVKDAEIEMLRKENQALKKSTKLFPIV